MGLARKFNCFYFNGNNNLRQFILDQIKETFFLIFLSSGDLQNCRPFLVAGVQVGLMQPRVVEAALRHPDVFHFDSGSGSVMLHPTFTTYEERSAKINHVLSQWREQSLFVTLKGWRDEVFHILSI